MSSELSVSETTLLRRPESANSEDVSSSTSLVSASPKENTLLSHNNHNRNIYFTTTQPLSKTSTTTSSSSSSSSSIIKAPVESVTEFIGGDNNNIQVHLTNSSILNPDPHRRKTTGKSYSPMKMETSKRILFRVGIDVLILLCIGFPILFFHLWGEPYKRGFFCDDESLKHPFKDSTVTNWMLYFIGIFIPVGMILTLEIIKYQTSTKKSSSKTAARYVIFDYEIPTWMIESYKKIGVFAFGAAVCQMTTDIAKYSIGRLRPHFFSVCQPMLPDNTTCANPANVGKYIQDFTCQGAGSSARMLKEMRLSFPSGHSSFTFYTMVYTVLYLQSSMTWRGSKLLRHFLQFLLIMIAWYTALSRISDYKHHWSDVLAGATLGALSAVIVANCVSDMFEKKVKSTFVLPTTNQDLPPQTIALNGH